MFATTSGRGAQNSLGQHEQLHPCPFIIVFSHGARPGEGQAWRAPAGTCREVGVLLHWISAKVGKGSLLGPDGRGKVVALPPAARAVGRQVGCTPNRVATVRPQTKQRCKFLKPIVNLHRITRCRLPPTTMERQTPPCSDVEEPARGSPPQRRDQNPARRNQETDKTGKGNRDL